MTAAWPPRPDRGPRPKGCATLPSVSHLLRAAAGRAGAPGGAGRPEPAFSPDELAAASGGTLVRRGTRMIRGGAVDSRIVEPGELFVALPGERTDGHRFLGDAVAAGAAGLLVSRTPAASALDALGDVTVVRVRDGLAG